MDEEGEKDVGLKPEVEVEESVEVQSEDSQLTDDSLAATGASA